MSARPNQHLLAQDERNRLHLLGRHEAAVRRRERIKLVRPLVQEPEHHFLTPIVAPYDHTQVVDHMLAPGTRDDTGFSDGVV